MFSRSLSQLLGASLLALTAAAAPAFAAMDNTPPHLAQAQDRGPTDPAKIVTLTVHLALADKAGFDRTVAALYRPGSASFHHWLTDKDLARFAPPPTQARAVRQALEAAGLHVISTDRNGFSLRVRGAVRDVARAFNTEIHDFARNGRVFRANIRNARLAGAAGDYVHSVAGIESHSIVPMLKRAVDVRTGAPLPNYKIRQVLESGVNSIITPYALGPVGTGTFTSGDESATFTGVEYTPNPALITDFQPIALQNVYGLKAAYNAGITGAGQNVLLLEAYGYPTNQSDAALAAKLFHLPPITSSNFSIVYPEGVPNPNLGIEEGWDIEIALDTQSAHAIAPGANIVVVATVGQDSEDFQYSMQYIIDNGIGSTVSDSWEEDQDISSGPAEQESFEDVLEVAAAKGISFQFSTGDGGDGGVGSPLGAPGVPSVAPHATAVGGTAILNVGANGGFKPVGWGDSYVFLESGGAPILPLGGGFVGGGGGGESLFWPKPEWQNALPGTGRQTPDVSALADPYTGFPLVVTSGGQAQLAPGWGGTSLASPIFTAFWALAQQKAGGPLGQASPTLAGLKKGLIDVLPLSSPNNLTASITNGSTTTLTAAQIFAGLIPQGQSGFVASYWYQPQYADALGWGFGLDTSLSVTPGWDNATGYGTPDGLAFINAVAAYH